MHTLHLYQIRTIIEVASKRCIKKPFWSTQWCKGGDHKASPFWVWIIHSCNFLSYLLNKCFFVKRTNNEKMTNSRILSLVLTLEFCKWDLFVIFIHCVWILQSDFEQKKMLFTQADMFVRSITKKAYKIGFIA